MQCRGCRSSARVRLARRIDPRRSYADLGRNLIAASVVGSALARLQHGSVPECGSGVGVEGVNRIMFGGGDQDVVRALSWNRNIRNVERLSVDVAIDCIGADL